MVINVNQYRLAIVTALPKEFAAVEVMLNQPFDIAIPNDPVRYTVGMIGPHPVVATLLPKMGNNLATAVSSNLLRSFPKVSDILMVGIAGGVPDPGHPEKHVKLGDIVLSTDAGVIQFDLGKFERIAQGKKPLQKRFTMRASDPPPSARLQQAIRLLEARRIRNERPWEQYIALTTTLENATRPSDTTDRLYDSHEPNKLIPHPVDTMRISGQPKLHYGVIGSSNMLLKEPQLRDRLRDEYNVRAIEMEGSGIAAATWMSSSTGYLLIRGICDYSDSHKNDRWQGYAAAVAAAYAKALIESIPVESASPTMSQLSHIQLNKLRKVLVDAFTIDDLELLCSDIEQDLKNDGIDLKVNLDIVGGKGQEIRCHNLLTYLNRRGYLQYLITATLKVRPNANLLSSSSERNIVIGGNVSESTIISGDQNTIL
ncbi:hypothetical protein KDA_30650 [Dictyobacter alpinus]|uniref:Nucleoside phosphorylase domain-containing protein n=1 Tax=Dictyobacter alpinus TaxID=2014873 RepID=A0A402B885_9CHLR|nr:hypothetical protein [Dictyobacter alpinus]GCE27581.1 hypothetical protein KDA_30650 [Dictyobacter alpinus]